MLYQILSVRIFVENNPRFNAPETYFRRFASTSNLTISTNKNYNKMDYVMELKYTYEGKQITV